MFSVRIFSISMLTLSFAITQADSMQKIEVLNNSAQQMNLDARNANGSFIVHQAIPAFAKTLVISQITTLNSLQDNLFIAVFRNSAEEVRQAITAGANVNEPREGRTPLAWALAYGMGNAAVCLLQHGAR